MKTKSGSRLNVEYDMICASPCIVPRVSTLSNRAATSRLYFRGEQNDCKLMLHPTTKYVFEQFKGSNCPVVPLVAALLSNNKQAQLFALTVANVLL